MDHRDGFESASGPSRRLVRRGGMSGIGSRPEAADFEPNRRD
jgi:hypothetical protein